MPKLEDLHKEAVKKFGEEPLTGAAEQRYRRVLGQLAWAALSQEGSGGLQEGHPSVTKGASPSAKHPLKVPFTKA